jgi:hypothetical protein
LISNFRIKGILPPKSHIKITPVKKDYPSKEQEFPDKKH